MESPASKRRKKSPTTSVPVESTTPPDPQPQEPRQQEPQSSPSPSAQRPSSSSPTRPRIAKPNPEGLLSRRDAAPSRPGDIPASEPVRPEDDADVDDAFTEEPKGLSEDGGVASSRGISAPASQRTATEPQSVAATRTSALSRSPSKHISGSILGAQPARRTPTRLQPRPLPPPGPEEEELIANLFDRRGLHRSPMNTGVLPAVVHEEPELPPTPQHPDPVVSTPPSGIHNTPSKRRREPRERDAMRQQGSPSRHALSQEATGAAAPSQKESQKARGRRGASPVKISGGTLSLPERSKEKEPPTPRPGSEFAAGTHPRRSVRRRGPNWEKEQERDALLKQVAQLEADLEMAKTANRNAAQSLPLADEESVLDLLRRHLIPVKEDEERDSSTEWMDTVMDPIVMLGFNGFSAMHLPPAVPDEGAKEDPELPITSHHPVPMNASEELPYLQMFTPLNFASSVATISPSTDQPDQPTFQKHTINIRSASPPGLFTARLEMRVNTRTNTVSSLTVPRLDPAASGELSPFFDELTSDQAAYHPVRTRNVNLLCWAMGEWYRIAVQRAKLWILLEMSLNSKDALVELVQSTRLRKKKRNRRQDQADEADSGAGESTPVSLQGDPNLFTKARLLSHMGRTSLDLEIPYLKMEDETEVSELRVKWAVEFDWTGEARNKLGVELGMPGKWQAIDERKSLVGIPKLFDKLLQGGETPLMAVRTVVALLAGEAKA